MRNLGLNPVSAFSGLLHCVKGSLLLASRGNRVYRSEDDGQSWSRLCTVPCSKAWLAKTSTGLGQRLFRAKVGHVLPMANNRYLIFGFGRIYVYDSDEQRFLGEPASCVGSRPLTLCQVSPQEVYYGQYCRNLNRQPVSIWATEDGGRQWEEVYRFEQVRHVHGVYQDPYSNSLWVTTGDDDDESAIWTTCDRFMTLKKVVSGSQQTRAVDLVFSKEHIYFGSDTPREQNWLYRWDRRTGEVERLQAVESSVFFGGRIGDWILFSTACEPSEVNQSAAASIWGSDDGTTWSRILTLRKDAWPAKYFEHGQIRFPYGLKEAKRLWLSPIAVEGHAQVLSCSLLN